MNQSLSMLLVIIVPIILFICLLNKRKWKFWLDDQGLHLQPLFWLLIIFPLIISTILWLLIYEDYSLNLTKDGYNQFIEYAKLPLLILTLSPILGAFVINTHRSIQIAKQIEETEKKNKIDIYYSKRKFINEQLSIFRTSDNEVISNPNSLYNKAFKLKNDYIDIPNNSFYDYLDELIYKIGTNFLVVKNNINHEKLYEKDSDSDKYIANDLIYLNLFIPIIRLKEQLNIIDDKEKNILFCCEKTINEVRPFVNINNRTFYNSIIINTLALNIYNFLNSVKEIILILSLDKNIDKILPHFNHTLSHFIINNIISKQHNNGDKVATENQNDHK